MNDEKDKPITVVKTHDDQIKFIEMCRYIYQNNKLNKSTTYCGIDFEFNMNWKLKERYIGSMQIIFIPNSEMYHSSDNEKPVFILNPIKLSPEHKKQFIKYILCSNIIKIFHGSDSLDFPHIYKDILKQNKKKFIKFINHTVDTRFLCEFSKHIVSRIGLRNTMSKKCSIYNALLDHSVISTDTFGALEAVSAKINYNKPWIIDELKEHQIIYSAYDVMYLYDLLESITVKILIDKTTDRSHMMDPLALVNRLYRFHMLNRLGICKMSLRCRNVYSKYRFTKQQSDTMNQKIMEHFLTSILYVDGENIHKLDLVFEDVLFIDTIRKSILSCLVVYETDRSKDVETMDQYMSDSNIFKSFKGHKTIVKIIKIIGKKSQNEKINITCDRS